MPTWARVVFVVGIFTAVGVWFWALALAGMYQLQAQKDCDSAGGTLLSHNFHYNCVTRGSVIFTR